MAKVNFDRPLEYVSSIGSVYPARVIDRNRVYKSNPTRTNVCLYMTNDKSEHIVTVDDEGRIGPYVFIRNRVRKASKMMYLYQSSGGSPFISEYNGGSFIGRKEITIEEGEGMPLNPGC